MTENSVSAERPSDGCQLHALCSWLGQVAPLRLAESWDNVGLLVGDRSRKVARVMTCLTITPAVVGEAEAEAPDLIIVHHPLPFKPLQRITGDSLPGQMLLRLIRADCAVYSAHTAFDSAATGINQTWAEHFQIRDPAPLVEPDTNIAGTATSVDSTTMALGGGRYGRLPKPISLNEFVRSAASRVGAIGPRRVGDADQQVIKPAFACGSGGSFLTAAARRGCDVLLTGEATFHTCLEAESIGIGLALLGHYWSERFAMEQLADRIGREFPELTVWASRREDDPIRRVDL